MKIRTNHHVRPVVDGWELSATERAEFDYHNWQAIDAGEDSASFFRYRGGLHDLGNVMRCEPGGELDAAGWHGYEASSFSTGVVVRLDECGEGLIVGTYCV